MAQSRDITFSRFCFSIILDVTIRENVTIFSINWLTFVLFAWSDPSTRVEY